MLLAALIILGSSAAILTLSLFVMAFAPQGYEDETGFHLGPEKSVQPEGEFIGALSDAKATA